MTTDFVYVPCIQVHFRPTDQFMRTQGLIDEERIHRLNKLGFQIPIQVSDANSGAALHRRTIACQVHLIK